MATIENDSKTVLQNLSVLYVEDEGLMREHLAMLLRRRVGHLDVAENGERGLEQFLNSRPDVVITDIEMPVMNGLIMIEKIRQISPTPIIIITAFDDSEHSSDHADYRLVKPIVKEDLIEALLGCASRINNGG